MQNPNLHMQSLVLNHAAPEALMCFIFIFAFCFVTTYFSPSFSISNFLPAKHKQMVETHCKDVNSMPELNCGAGAKNIWLASGC